MHPTVPDKVPSSGGCGTGANEGRRGPRSQAHRRMVRAAVVASPRETPFGLIDPLGASRVFRPRLVSAEALLVRESRSGCRPSQHRRHSVPTPCQRHMDSSATRACVDHDLVFGGTLSAHRHVKGAPVSREEASIRKHEHLRLGVRCQHK